MLKGLDPRLNAELLFVLRAMGHGDALVLADANFPADQVARHTSYGQLLRMDNLSAAEAASAILSFLPLDTLVDDFALRMELVDQPQIRPYNAKCRPKSIGTRGAHAPYSASSALPFTMPRGRPTPLFRPASAAFTAVSCSVKGSFRPMPKPYSANYCGFEAL